MGAGGRRRSPNLRRPSLERRWNRSESRFVARALFLRHLQELRPQAPEQLRCLIPYYRDADSRPQDLRDLKGALAIVGREQLRSLANTTELGGRSMRLLSALIEWADSHSILEPWIVAAAVRSMGYCTAYDAIGELTEDESVELVLAPEAGFVLPTTYEKSGLRAYNPTRESRDWARKRFPSKSTKAFERTEARMRSFSDLVPVSSVTDLNRQVNRLVRFQVLGMTYGAITRQDNLGKGSWQAVKRSVKLAGQILGMKVRRPDRGRPRD